ncbi:aquaporin [Patescibacteria group bacterium]|nr:aquaporin [Patescibacteria group bacterium]
MATTKAASTKRATAKKPAAAKTTVRTVRTSANTERTASASAARVKANALPNNIVNIVFAELVGTFVLTLVALLAFKETSALYVGLTLSLLVVAIGAVSGSHVNPAVTFGLWTMRKLKTVLVPFYWGAQFLGAMLAVIVTNWLANGAVKLNFDHFTQLNWSLLGVELVGTAIFMFGLAAAVSRVDLSAGAKALGVGFSLMVGLLVGGSLLASVQGAVDTSKITSVTDVPHVLRVKGAALNPAVAVAATEATDSSFTGTRGDGKEKQFSRLGWEVVLGSLVGAALGGNLYLLVAGRRNS